jgi:predicted thioesterase
MYYSCTSPLKQTFAELRDLEEALGGARVLGREVNLEHLNPTTLGSLFKIHTRNTRRRGEHCKTRGK